MTHQPTTLSKLPVFQDLMPVVQGNVEQGAKFATRQQRKSKVNRLKLSKNTKLKHRRLSKIK